MNKDNTSQLASSQEEQLPKGQEPTTSEGQEPESPTIVNELRAQLARQESIIKDLRAKDAARRTKERDTEVARQAELVEQGNYKELAATHKERADQLEARVKALEPLEASYATLAQSFAEQIKEETKNWPTSVKALDPGKDASIEQRLAWLNKARPIVNEINLAAKSAQPGNSPNPQPAKPNQQQRVQQLKQQSRERYMGF